MEAYWDDDQIKQISMDSDASICTRIGIPDVKATFGRAILFAFFVGTVDVSDKNYAVTL